MTYIWKGKQKATAEQVERWRRDEEDDEDDEGPGSIINMEFAGTGTQDQTYTVPLKIGSSQQPVSLQVDTGSGDIWIASSSCSSCPPASRKYDPNSSQSSQSSNVPFTINYLRGKASGTIYWDTVDFGGYSIENQALAAADDVQDEPLDARFNGVLGLSLPRNSIISSLIPGGTAGGRDGAHITSNLFSISPQSSAPPARFVSMTFSRLGSNAIPSLMGIGKHPTSQVPSIANGTQVKYSVPLASTNEQGVSVGTVFWKTSVRDITVWVDGQPRVVKLTRSGIGGSGGGGLYPTAVLDTGIPLIFSTRAIADAIYGAIGVSPASDGNYYMNCKTPLNLTITLDDRPPISLHPLDLSAEPSRGATSANCIGVIQAADGELQTAGVADMILGIPFIRNTYMVMAYQIPNSDGTFPDLSDSNISSSAIVEYKPFLGLQGLTDPAVAMNEFLRVRVQGLPLDGDGNRFSGGSDDKKKIGVGLEILFGLLGFLVLCCGLFGLRWCIMRRRRYTDSGSMGTHTHTQRSLGPASDAGATAISNSGLFGWWGKKNRRKQKEKKGTYELAVGRWSEEDILPHEDVLRQRRFDEYMRKERMKSEYTVSSAQTRVDDEDEPAGNHKGPDEEGRLEPLSERESTGNHLVSINNEWDPAKDLEWGDNRATLVERGRTPELPQKAYNSTQHDSDPETSPERPMLTRPLSDETPSHPLPAPALLNGHTRRLSETPLLPPVQENVESSAIYPDLPNDEDLAEFGSLSMAGVGTAARSSRVVPDVRHDITDVTESSRDNSSPTFTSPVDEFASQNRPLSVASRSSQRGRPTVAPAGPRRSSRGP
ncbi:hypothetical protein AAF712_007111 [Marasmius tenuissimus]|uniref:Peptidase A1 domain-containing protein n=1 Tax=Marasmius tenuissimus TaxID=585030 RepID=A0ABR2ZYD1_9AGAR